MTLTYDLFIGYIRLTSEQVATSTRWHSGFVPKEKLLQAPRKLRPALRLLRDSRRTSTLTSTLASIPRC